MTGGDAHSVAHTIDGRHTAEGGVTRAEAMAAGGAMHSDTAVMLVATFGTGIIDAIGYLGFDRIFTANMTGNVIVLGMGLAGNDLPVVSPLVALAAFFCGALHAGRFLAGVPKGWSRKIRWVFMGEAAELAAIGVALMGADLQPESVQLYVFTALIAYVLGVQACAARKVGVKDVTTVVVTSTIVGLASESRAAGGSGEGGARKFAAVVSISLGALVGGALHRVGDCYGVFATAAVIAAVALMGRSRERHEADSSGAQTHG